MVLLPHGVTRSVRCYTWAMPTIRPRHAITETPAVAQALENARLTWPQDKDRPSRLLLRLIEAGNEAISPEIERERRVRLETVRRTAGSFEYPDGYLENLRSEWP